MTITELGATAGTSGILKVGYDLTSGAFFDTYQTSGTALTGFYLRKYIDYSLGTDPVTLEGLNPYKH